MACHVWCASRCAAAAEWLVSLSANSDTQGVSCSGKADARAQNIPACLLVPVVVQHEDSRTIWRNNLTGAQRTCRQQWETSSDSWRENETHKGWICASHDYRQAFGGRHGDSKALREFFAQIEQGRQVRPEVANHRGYDYTTVGLCRSSVQTASIHSTRTGERPSIRWAPPEPRRLVTPLQPAISNSPAKPAKPAPTATMKDGKWKTLQEPEKSKKQKWKRGFWKKGKWWTGRTENSTKHRFLKRSKASEMH